MKYDRMTPEGTRDLIFEECEARNRIQSEFYDLFKSRGFDEVVTPTMEFYDVFCENSGQFPQEEMHKLTDHKGRLMVLRPDCTIPIARLAATRLSGQPLPLRLFYGQPVFRSVPTMKGKSNEVYQMGVELIGSRSARADLEILQLATRCLRNGSNRKFRIEICHIGYFKSIIESLDTDGETREQIRTLIERKNYAALNDLLEQFEGSKAAAALKYLPRLFGGAEVFDEARSLFDENGSGTVLDYLKSIYESLVEMGLADRVMVDLGLVNYAEYYTGVIFRGYLDGLGEPVLSGGRYDNLIGDFGVSLPATGFGVNIDLFAKRILLDTGKVSKSVPDVLIHGTHEMELKVFECIDRLCGQGLVCENSVFSNLEEARGYALRRGIPKIIVVDEMGELEVGVEG